MRKLWMALLALMLTGSWIFIGCGDDDTDDPEPQDSDTGTTAEFYCTLDDFYTVDDGNFCHDDYQCKSRFCEAWSSIPRDPNAKCAAAPTDDKELRYLATVYDFETRQPMPGVEVRALPGAKVQASADPRNYPPTQTVTSDKDGRVDMTLVEGVDLTDILAEIVAAEHPGYYFTGTGVVEKNSDGTWPEGSATNNMLMVPLTLVEKIQKAMLDDPTTQDIPWILGDDGGAMGRIYALSDGEPVVGAILKTRQPDNSIARIVYPNDDNTGFQPETSSTGMFLIFKPGVGEKFDVFKDNVQISTPWDEGTTGSKATFIFALDMWIDDIPWCDNTPVSGDR